MVGEKSNKSDQSLKRMNEQESEGMLFLSLDNYRIKPIAQIYDRDTVLY